MFSFWVWSRDGGGLGGLGDTRNRGNHVNVSIHVVAVRE